jgi:large subunit ribosomal protein L28
VLVTRWPAAIVQRVRARQVTLGAADRLHGIHQEETMAAVCQVTGAVPGFGHNISHSHRRTKRRFDPNVQKKTYYVPSLRRNVTLNVSAKGIKVIDARGIESVVAGILARGEKI